MARNIAELRGAARAHGVDLGVYFARKANKALGLVDRAVELGAGIDVASEQELQQVLDRGIDGDRVVVTAAVKPRGLLELCARSGALVVVDNRDELEATRQVATGAGVRMPIAIRLAVSGAAPERPPTRFGIDPAEVPELLASAGLAAGNGDEPALRLRGLHFHLDGYDPADRAEGLRIAIAIADRFAAAAPPRVHRHRRWHSDALPRGRGGVGGVLGPDARRAHRQRAAGHLSRQRARAAPRGRDGGRGSRPSIRPHRN